MLLPHFLPRIGRLVVLFAALSLSYAVPSRAQEKAATTAPSSEIVTDLASFWMDGAREKVRQIKMEVYVNYYDPAWNLLWAEVNGDCGYLFCATKMPIRSGDKFLIEGTVIPEKGLSANTAKITVLERDGSREPLEVAGQLSDAVRLKARLVTFDANRAMFFGHSQGGQTGPGFVGVLDPKFDYGLI